MCGKNELKFLIDMRILNRSTYRLIYKQLYAGLLDLENTKLIY